MNQRSMLASGSIRILAILLSGIAVICCATALRLIEDPTKAAGATAQKSGLPLAAQKETGDRLWQATGADRLPGLRQPGPKKPLKFQAYRLDRSMMQQVLDGSVTSGKAGGTISIPMPDGKTERFTFKEASVVRKKLADKYPILKTFRGQGIDDPSATLRFDFMGQVFRGMVLSDGGTVLVDPTDDSDGEYYLSHFLADSERSADEFACPLDIAGAMKDTLGDLKGSDSPHKRVTAGDELRTYIIAIGVTAEWTNLMGGGTLVGGLSRVVSILNRIDLIYERDAAITLILAADNDNVIFVGSSPYNNSSLQTMLLQNKNIIRSRVFDQYGLAHAFGTATSGGAAGISLGIGTTCGSERESAVSKITVDSGFDLLTPVHEIGHQMGASHTFNKIDQRDPGSAFEPGFGYSIMSHGGNFVIGSFHVRSVEQIVAYTQAGSGSICTADVSPSGNTPPDVSAPSEFNIPKQTPFSLTASATDVDGDSLTYAWQEYDLGATSPPDTDLDGSERPILRVYDPVTDPTRYFPSLTFIRNNANVPPAVTVCNGTPCFTHESLPNITRTMHFQVLARDNQSGNGAVNTATSTVNVDGNSGPFVLTSPNTSLDALGGDPMQVTWDVANTTSPPVSAANVDIRLSTDGGLTFPITLAEATANDGSETVVLPVVDTHRARVMVIGDENVFFDISDVNFAITDCAPGSCPPLEISPPASNIPRGGTVDFQSSGGSGGHTFSIIVNNSQGSVDASSGTFTAGPGVGIDVIRVTDSVGATADATVTTEAACIAGEKSWDGGGATANWSDAGNWTCDEVPAASGEHVVFDVTNQKNANVDIPVSIGAWNVAQGYGGTITLADGIDFTVTDPGGYIQSAGNVVGGSGTITTPTLSQEGGTFFGGTGNVLVSEKFEMTGGTFSAPSGITEIHGAFVGNGIFSGESGTVLFSGDGSKTIVLPSTGSSQFNNVTLDGTGALPLTGELTTFGTLRLVNGAFQGGSVRVFGGMIVEATYTDNTAAPAKVTLTGNSFDTYQNNGGVTPRGEWVIDGVKTLASDLDISVHSGSVFRLLSGRVRTGSFKVNAGTRNIIRTTGLVEGNLRRDFSTTGDKLFPVGSGNQFDPATVSVLAPLSGTQGMTVGVSGLAHPAMNEATSLRCHWTVTEHGTVNANLSFTYTDSCDPNAVETLASVARINNGVLSFTGDAISASTNTFTVLNETDFGSYSIGIDPSPCPSGQRLWDGGGVTDNWSEAANWACDLVPENGNNIVFDSTSSKNNVIDVPISVNSIRMNAGFTGNISFTAAALSVRDFTLSSGTFNGGAGSINITGLFTQSGGAFNGGIGPLSFAGAFNLTGGSFTASSGTTSFASSFKRSAGTFAHNDGTVAFTGSVATNINQGLPVTTVETFNNLTFNRAGIAILRVNGVMNVLGTLNLTAGQVLSDGVGSALKANGDVFVGGNFNGLIPLHHIGTANQNITVTGSPTTPWNSWTVDKPAGSITLLSNLRWPGGLQQYIFLNGTIFTGNFVLDLGGANGFAVNSYVIGNLKKTVSFSSKIFEVGTQTGYSPVTIESSGFNIDYTVRADDGALSGVDTARSIGRHWSISTSSTSSANITFQYLDADVPASADESAFKFIRRSGAINQAFDPTSADPGTNTFRLDSVTEFSDWSLGLLAPTAARATVSGRVLTPSGMGIARARIDVAGPNGIVATVVTNSFGRYAISDLPTGSAYSISVSSKKHDFITPVRVINLTDDLADVDFVSGN